MTNRSHRPLLRAALQDDHVPAGREAVLARSFWAAGASGLATVVSLADASRLRAGLSTASSGAARAASRGLPRTP